MLTSCQFCVPAWHAKHRPFGVCVHLLATQTARLLSDALALLPGGRDRANKVEQPVFPIELVRSSITECISIVGGGISSYASTLSVTLTDVAISKCSALVTGGAILIEPNPYFTMVRKSG